MKRLVAFSVALLSTSALFAHEDPAAKELRAEINALKQRVAALEKLLAADKPAAEPKQPKAVATPAPKVSSSDKTPAPVKSSPIKAENDGGNVLVPSRKAAVGKWVQLENWRLIKKGMTPKQIEALFGKPYKVQPSFLRGVDEYWLYFGKLTSGNTSQGRVRFYKGKVTSWETPDD
jgi:hypothetical protein